MNLKKRAAKDPFTSRCGVSAADGGGDRVFVQYAAALRAVSLQAVGYAFDEHVGFVALLVREFRSEDWAGLLKLNNKAPLTEVSRGFLHSETRLCHRGKLRAICASNAFPKLTRKSRVPSFVSWPASSNNPPLPPI